MDKRERKIEIIIMVNFITVDASGSKVGQRITSRKDYFAVRNTAENPKSAEVFLMRNIGT